MRRPNPATFPVLVTLVVFLGTYALGAALFYDRNFVSMRSAASLLNQNAVLGIAAVGATYVILAGGIDLSVGAVVALAATIVAVMVARGWHPLAAWAVAVAAGTTLGGVMGGLIHLFRLPAFMVTLAGMFFARASAFWVCPKNIGIDHPFYAGVQAAVVPVGGKASLTLLAVGMLALYAVATFVAQLTPFGRNVYVLGGDETTAGLMSVPVGRTRVATYAVGGFCSALAGVGVTVFRSAGDPAAYVGLELDAIAAAVIGGTLVTGGVGFVPATLLGVLIQGMIQTLIDFQGGISSWWTKIVVGLFLLALIGVQRLLLRSSNRATA